ncbi:uncharacterized protein isoform X2 [Leptinotarsa decemlineata]|uniref:uncharacterized protein isoform X2 n=1 Tax=Leptinotarsa decemlineata TaxID=7539 RepID=UPI003D30D31B
MSEEFVTDYKDGDIVWVKLGPSWWPGEVKDPEKLPPDIDDFKKPPLVIVKFFDEDTYEFVKSWANVHPYNCEKKKDFIKKGMTAFRAKTPHMEKFPKDVTNAEVKVGGNPNILSESIFLPEKKRNYVADIFGTPSPKPKSLKDKKRNSKSKKDTTHITHRRFIGLDDYKAYICIQYPGKDRIPGDRDDDEVIRINKEPEEEYNCYSCGFATKRLEVMVLHTKSHIYGTYSPRKYKKATVSRPKKKEKVKKPKRSMDSTDSSSSDTEAPKVKKRKTKSSPAKKKEEECKAEEEEPKRPADFRSDLLAEWEVSEDETMSESLQDRSSQNESLQNESLQNESLQDESLQDHSSQNESLILNRTIETESSLMEETADSEDKSADNSVVKETVVVDDSIQESDEVIEIIEDEETPLTKRRASPKPKMDKETQEAIKSCFDFDEDEEDEHAIINTTAIVGRKIPRVIPPTEKRKSEMLDEVIVVQDKEDVSKSSEKKGEEQLSSEDIDNAFKELMHATEVPELPQVHNTLKCEQNFHSVKTIKFPDKTPPTEMHTDDSGEQSCKSELSSKTGEKPDQEVATKLTNPKKRFVKCFEDFELMQNELRRKEEQEQEARRKEAAKKRESQTASSDQVVVTKPDQNIEKQLETIFGPLSKSPEIEEDDDSLLDYGSLKTKIMSSIMEEANINEESRSKIISNMQKKHQSPRSKMLESYLHDKSRDEDSSSIDTDSRLSDDAKKRLMPEEAREDTRSVVPPKKEKWTRRRSHPKKERQFFQLDDGTTRNESVTSDIHQRSLEADKDTLQATGQTGHSRTTSDDSPAASKASRIEELLETLESSNEEDSNINENFPAVGNKMETVTVQPSPKPFEGPSAETATSCESPKHADEDQNKEIVEICENIRNSRKECASEEEHFPFGLSTSERDDFSPIGNASRILPDDAICSPPKKSNKRKKSRHKSSKSKRRRKHSWEFETDESVAEKPVDSSATEFSTAIGQSCGSITDTKKQTAEPVAVELPVDSSENLEDQTVVQDSSVATVTVDESLVTSPFVDERSVVDETSALNDSSIVDESLVVNKSPKTVESHLVDESCAVDESTVADQSANDNAATTQILDDNFAPHDSQLDNLALTEASVENPIEEKGPVSDTTNVVFDTPAAESHVDHFAINEASIESPIVEDDATETATETPIDNPTPGDGHVDNSAIAKEIVGSLAATVETLVDSTDPDDSCVDNSAATETSVNSAVTDTTFDKLEDDKPIDSSAGTETVIDNSAVTEAFVESPAGHQSPVDSSVAVDSVVDTTPVTEISDSTAEKSSIDNSMFPYSPIDSPAVVESPLEGSAVADDATDDESAMSKFSLNSPAERQRSIGPVATDSPVDHSTVSEASTDYVSLAEKISAVDRGSTSVKCSIDLSVVALPERFLVAVDKRGVSESSVEQSAVAEISVGSSTGLEQFNEGSAEGCVDMSVENNESPASQGTFTEVSSANDVALIDEENSTKSPDVVSTNSSEVDGQRPEEMSNQIQYGDLVKSSDDVGNHIAEHVTEKVVSGENSTCDGAYDTENVVMKDCFSQDPTSQEFSLDDAPVTIEEVSNDIHEDNKSDAHPKTTVLGKSCEELLTEEIVETVAGGSFDGTVAECKENSTDDAQKLLQEHHEPFANEAFESSHQEVLQEKHIVEQMFNEEETIEEGVVIDDLIEGLFEKRDELIPSEEKSSLIEIESLRKQEFDTSTGPSKINYDQINEGIDDTVVKEIVKKTEADQNADGSVHNITEQVKDTENFDFAETKLQSEVPDQVESFRQDSGEVIFHQDCSEVIEEVEVGSSERGNESFESVQSKTDSEINLLEQEVVQEVNIETEEITEIDHISNAEEIIRNETFEIEKSDDRDDDRIFPVIADSEPEKMDEVESTENDSEIPILDKLQDDIVAEETVTEEIHPEVDAMPTNLQGVVVDRLINDGNVIEQGVALEANKTPEVIAEMDQPEKTDYSKVDTEVRDDFETIVSAAEEQINQVLPQLKPEKPAEEASKLPEKLTDEPMAEILESNKLEVKCVSDTEDEFKFSIQTNLSNLSSREEISAIALATLAEIKTDFENSDSNTSEEVLPKQILPYPEKLSEPELVAIEGNLTVVSEKDLADGQVEITSEKVISSKKPTTLSTFSMDFSDSTNDSTSTNSDIIPKFPEFESKGTEFNARAITKELKPKSDIKKPNTYERYELLDILEGNSDMERKSEYHAPQKPFDADMCDFEEHIPSQIVCSSKFRQDMDELQDEIKKKERPHNSSIISTTSKLLERLSESKSGDLFKTEAKTTMESAAKDIAGKSLIPKTFKPITLRTKPIIISEQIIKPAAEVVKPEEKPNMLNDIEGVEAFVIPKDMKKHIVEEEAEPDLSLRSSRASRKKAGKANILQQTIITPEGEIISSAKKRGAKQTPVKSITVKASAMSPLASRIAPAPASSVSSTIPLSLKPQPPTLLVKPSTLKPMASPKPSVTQDDNIFDINSMPIVLSDQILTPESIENMPIVIDNDASSSKRSQQEKDTPAKQSMVIKSVVTATPTLLTTRAPNTASKISRPRILQSVSTSKTSKVSPLLPATPKSGKFILVPQGAVPQAPSSTKLVTKKAVVKKTTTPTVGTGIAAKPVNLAPEPSGNKIMIVTNQQGQQQRLLLTPAQQKMLGYQNQGAKLPKTFIKGNILPKTTPVSKVEAGTSKIPSLVGQKLIISTSSAQNLMATTSQVLVGTGKVIKTTPKPQIPQKKPTTIGKTPKTILITSKQGHTVKKITTTEDDIEKQVAEQLEAIKARSGMKLASQPKPTIDPAISTACKPVHKVPSRRSYSKKVEQRGRQISPPQVSPIQPGETRKLLPDEPKLHPDRPLNQLVIQDAVGNQTTITEGQILALPSETVGGHPQSYMLVTLDETGNLTPLNNEALLSLDPNLGLGGDLSNMVLQIDQGAMASGTTQAMPLAQSATVKLSNPGEALRAGTSKIDIPVANAPVTIPVASTTLQETVIDPRGAPPQNVLSIPETPVGMQPMVPSSNGEPGSGQQLIVTGDPIATQKFLESLTEGTTDLANILANAEGKSILIQADGQQILINTNADNQMLLSVNNDNVNASENTEGGGNPIFATQPNKNTDILAAALADTDVFTAQPKIAAQLSPSAALYPMNVGNVLETITLNSPIMTPLEVASTNAKKVSDEADILSQVPKNVDLPITITDPNIAQTVANQQVASLMPNELHANLELSLPMSEGGSSVGLTSPGYSYSLPTLDEGVDMTHKPFNSSMPLLNDDIEEPPQQPLQLSKKHGRERKERESRHSDDINSDGSFLEEESRFTLGGEMCSSLSEPPPEMFDIPEVNSYVEKHTNNIPLSLHSTPDSSDGGLSKDGGDTTDMSSTQAESSNDGSCEIPLQPRIMARGFDSIRRSDGRM